MVHQLQPMCNSNTVIDNREGCALEEGGIWEFSVPFAQYFCKPKSALKAKTIKNRYIRI